MQEDRKTPPHCWAGAFYRLLWLARVIMRRALCLMSKTY